MKNTKCHYVQFAQFKIENINSTLPVATYCTSDESFKRLVDKLYGMGAYYIRAFHIVARRGEECYIDNDRIHAHKIAQVI